MPSIILRIDGERWAVRLSGEIIDLREATELFDSGRQIVRDQVLPERETVVLQADDLSCSTHLTKCMTPPSAY